MPKHIDNRILLIRTKRSEIKIIDSITKSWEKKQPLNLSVKSNDQRFGTPESQK